MFGRMNGKRKRMNIALDYDDTFTRDPAFWGGVIRWARSRGHRIFICTCRAAKDNDDMALPCNMEIYFTGGSPKRKFMADLGIRVDVWIDDMPEMILDVPLIG